uniref:hypothetical protein n=1 Tax=Salipiger aestuarii TaxID=568098 RepID=UPI0016807625|nr:hypothetical protein [Salipiger aestuarii]
MKLKLDIDPDIVAMMAAEVAAGERAVTAANLIYRRGDLAVLAAGFDGCAEGAHRQDGLYRHRDAIALEAKHDRVRGFALAPAHSAAPASSDCPR